MKRQPYLIALLVLFFLVLTSGCSNTKKDWQEAEQLGTVKAYETFLQKHSQGQFADSARQEIEELEWQKTMGIGTVELYETFLQEHSQGQFADRARQEIEELEWQKTISLGTVKAYEMFLQKHPQGQFADSSRHKIEEIEWKKILSINTVEVYDSFMQKYPQSEFNKKAKFNKDILKMVIPKIDHFFIYEGSEVLIFFYDPQDKLIKLKYINSIWEILKSEVSEVKRGKVMIVGSAKAGTKLPVGARVAKGTFTYEGFGTSSIPIAGEGGVVLVIEKEL